MIKVGWGRNFHRICESVHINKNVDKLILINAFFMNSIIKYNNFVFKNNYIEYCLR